jgi:hypothetical protein
MGATPGEPHRVGRVTPEGHGSQQNSRKTWFQITLKHMDTKLLKIVQGEARKKNLLVKPDFGPFMDQYLAKTDAIQLSEEQKALVATYLSAKALKIAEVEAKPVVDFSDVKAAIWHYHPHNDPEDPCTETARSLLDRHLSDDLHSKLPNEFQSYLDSLPGLMGGLQHG